MQLQRDMNGQVILPNIQGKSDSPNKSIQTVYGASSPKNSQIGLNATGQAFFDKTKQDAQAERLIYSVNAVTELLKANTELRDQMEGVERELESKEAENS